MACILCGGEGDRFHVREMMFGLEERFEYLKCMMCGCLSIVSPPDRIEGYYQSGYYAHSPAQGFALTSDNPIRRWIRERRNEAQIFRRRGFWGTVAERRPRPDLWPIATMLRPTGLGSLKARILDVGCGNAELLIRLHEAGFSSLLGIDPFLSGGWSSGRGLEVRVASLDSITDPAFDLIMFHHSLEHMPDQIGMLAAAAKRLTSKGTCLVRIPVLTEEIWRKFGTYWVEIDSPRHFCIHTPNSLALAAGRAGLEVFRTEFDSTGFTYWGSELYRRGLTLHDANRGAMRDPSDIFEAAEIEAYQAMAVADNTQGVGGRAAFYLRRTE